MVAAACAPLPLFGEEEPRPTQRLTLIGDRHLYLEAGARTELRVRYHDAEGQPLFGVVDFEIRGDGSGAALTVPAVTTDASGIASVTLDARVGSQAAFEVEASAVDARPVTWSLTIEGPRVPLSPAGSYRIDSRFEVVTGLYEGRLSEVIHDVLELSREPGSFVLEMAAELGSIHEEQASALGPELTDFIANEEPELAARLGLFGPRFAEVSKGFGVSSTMTVTAEGEASHALSGLILTLADRRYPFTLSDLGVASAGVAPMSAHLSDDRARLHVDEHALALPYGALYEAALHRVLPAAVGADSKDFPSFLLEHIPCQTIASWMDDQFGMGLHAGFSACQAAVLAAADEVLGWLEALDHQGIDLVILGEARPVDTTGDGKAEVLLDGVWQGKLELGGTPAARLDASQSPFRAERI
jgi:hypothetical protein